MKFRMKRYGTKKYVQDMWICMTRMDKGVEACDMPAAHEEKLKQDFVKGFDEDLFREVIDRVTVLSIVEVEFQFKSGLRVREIL